MTGPDVKAQYLAAVEAKEKAREETAWPVPDPAMFYALAGKVIRTLEPHTESDLVALLVSFLTAFGCAVGPGPCFRVDSTDHPPRLFTVLVGKTSRSRKGTSWRNVKRIFAKAEPEWTAERVMGGLSSGEGLIAAIADPEENAEGELVGGVTDKRLLVVEEEFSRVLAVASRDGNTLSENIRQAWDDGDLRIMTKKQMRATGGFICVIGHITLEELRSKLTETDKANGFGNRFCFVCCRRSKHLARGGNPTTKRWLTSAA